MNPTMSPLEFLLTNVICFAAGAATVVGLQLAAKVVVPLAIAPLRMLPESTD